MQKIEALNELLPGFEQFLDDLSSLKLTSDLEKRADSYKNRIKNYIEQYSTQPLSAPPPIPETPIQRRPGETFTQFAARQRQVARETYSSSGGSMVTEEENLYEDEDKYLEPSPFSSPPAIPTTKRPMSLRPPSTTSADTDAHHSGSGSITYDEPIERQIDAEEDNFLYDDIDVGDGEPAEDSFSEEEFEEVGEEGTVKAEDYESNTQEWTGKIKEFHNRFKDDTEVDMIGALYYYNIYGTISKRFGGKWDKRYCVARDCQLHVYNNPTKKKPFLSIVLPGHTVELSGKESGKKNVIIIQHPGKSKQLFSCTTKDEADRWIEVLQDYATMGNQIIPDSGVVEVIEETKEEEKVEGKKKKKNKLFNKNKQKKEVKPTTPQLSLDENGVLSGYVNLLGGYYGEPKWKKCWISIQSSSFKCHTAANDLPLYSFDLKKVGIDLADSKECKGTSTFKIFSGEEVYIHVEALHILDTGSLLKGLVAGMTSDKVIDKTSQSGLVAKLMAAFQSAEEGQPLDYENLPFPVNGSAVSRNSSSASDISKGASNDGTVKTGKEKVNIVQRYGYLQAPEMDKTVKSKPVSPSIARRKLESVSTVKELDRLQGERAAMEKNRKDLAQLKKDIRMKKFQVKTDMERLEIDEQLKDVQRQWSEMNNNLVDLDMKITEAKRGNQPRESVSDSDAPTSPVKIPISASNVKNIREKFSH